MVAESASKLFVFTFTFALIFGILGVAFTSFASTTQPEFAGLTQEDLISAGIFLTNTDTYNLSRGETHVFTVIAPEVEVVWKEGETCEGVSHDVFWFSRANSFIGWLLKHWYLLERNNEFYDICILEEWVVEDFDTDYNWTHWVLKTRQHFGIGGQDRLDVFFTIPSGYGSIVDAIEDGYIQVTVGKGMDEDPSWWTFIGWYLGMSLPTSQYGKNIEGFWVFRMVLFIMNSLAVIALYMMIRG